MRVYPCVLSSGGTPTGGEDSKLLVRRRVFVTRVGSTLPTRKGKFRKLMVHFGMFLHKTESRGVPCASSTSKHGMSGGPRGDSWPSGSSRKLFHCPRCCEVLPELSRRAQLLFCWSTAVKLVHLSLGIDLSMRDFYFPLCYSVAGRFTSELHRVSLYKPFGLLCFGCPATLTPLPWLQVTSRALPP